MDLKKLNRNIGNIVFLVGTIKIIYLVFLMLKILNILGGAFNGGVKTSGVEGYGAFSSVLAWVELIVSIACLIVMIMNVKYEINGMFEFAKVIIAVIIQMITPAFFGLYVAFAAAFIYMNAGRKIVKINTETNTIF